MLKQNSLVGEIVCVLLAIVVLSPMMTWAQSPGEMMGGGNIPYRGDLQSAETRFQVLNEIGCSYCRIPISPDDYQPDEDGGIKVEMLDPLIQLAHQYNIKPMILFEYYTRWGDELGSYDQWHTIGQTFAERFAPNSPWMKKFGIDDWGVRYYSAINEPMWKDNNPNAIPVEAYYKALEGLADGVHSIDPSLHVSPGGFQEIPLLEKNPYGPAIAPLYNLGKLYAIDIHRYYDIKYQPMEGTYKNSLQNQFDEVKKAWGITEDIKFYTTEFNFKKREITEDQAAKGFLTAIWDALGVVNEEGEHVTQFALPWNIFHNEDRDKRYGLCKSIDPWIPNARGKVLKMVCDLSEGMAFVELDPRERGEYVLQAENEKKKLIVWQNRFDWSTIAGDEYPMENIPQWATDVNIYGWDGLRKSEELGGQSSYVIKGLPMGETYMFLLRGE